MRTFLIGHLVVACSAFALSPPTSLTVVSATNKKVQLTWKAGGSDTNQYTIERRPLDGTVFSAIAAVVPDKDRVLATAFADAVFDPFTAYVYRVRAVNTIPLTADISDPTNEVTVGPPPYGYNLVIPTPKGLPYSPNRGARPHMVLDASGDPVFAYLNRDPDDDGNSSDNEILFFRWDRAHYRWTPPIRIARPGDAESAVDYSLNYRIACDLATGAIALLYVDATIPEPNQLAIADSTDGGVTWRKRVVAGGDGGYHAPALAMAGGKVHLTYFRGFDGIRYQSGKLSDDPSGWSSERVPDLGMYHGAGSDVALDSDGNPGVTYMLTDSGSHREMFYRPGGLLVTANSGTEGPGDFWQLRLSFAGTSPRVAFAGQLDSMYFEDYDHMLFLLTSTDNGNTWKPPANVISDGNSDLAGPMDLSFDSKGRGAIVTHRSGGNSTGVVCGTPKLSLSEDLERWKTCGITATVLSIAYDPSVRYVSNDTIYMSFQIPDYPFDPEDPHELPAGLYFWRGPIGFQFPTPPPPVE